MKVAPLWAELSSRGRLAQTLVHTGQHYDPSMSDVFFKDLGLPPPDIHLNVGSGTHAEQTAKAMVALERSFRERRPDLVSVVGDVNSTLAAALVAAKSHLPLAHVEAGLRSRDRSMPEEVNRVVCDQLADLLLTPSRDANENLFREGVPGHRVFLVGNVMIDSLLGALEKALRLPTLERLGLSAGRYAVATLHRAGNVDDAPRLLGLIGALVAVSRLLPLALPLHPHTQKVLEEKGLLAELAKESGLVLLEPLGYLEFLSLTSRSRLVLTDSGGLQEESTVLGIPCLTLRENTERPVTVTEGTNQVVGTKPAAILAAAKRALDEPYPGRSRIPLLWDGRAASRIADVYERFLA